MCACVCVYLLSYIALFVINNQDKQLSKQNKMHEVQSFDDTENLTELGTF